MPFFSHFTSSEIIFGCSFPGLAHNSFADDGAAKILSGIAISFDDFRDGGNGGGGPWYASAAAGGGPNGCPNPSVCRFCASVNNSI